MAVIPNSCRECNQHDCVNHQFEWFMKNNPNINNANSVSPNCPLLKEVPQEPILDKLRAEIETKYGRCTLVEYFVQYDGICTGRKDIGDIADILQIIDKHKAEIEPQENEEQTEGK